ncbi:MAG: CopY family transcriptional repressor [Alphaproteobacteria bacterium]|nr:CopY family transcriptional repressor [Alphaproteobacteria bacterium]
MSEKITDAEYVVMEVLWNDAPLAAAEVATRLKDKKRWRVQTVKTLLSRLVEKGAVNAEPDGRRYLYRPLVTRGAYARQATRSLADRLFGGRAAPLVAHLADAGALTRDDIAELEAILEELKR